MEDLFKAAAREKYRFDSPVGKLSVEDLFELPLKSRSKNKPNLNDIAKGLNRALKDDSEEDFVTRRTRPNQALKNMFDIVLDVIKVKQDEMEAAEAAEKRRQQKDKILTILAKKQDEALEGKSEDELRTLLAEM